MYYLDFSFQFTEQVFQKFNCCQAQTKQSIFNWAEIVSNFTYTPTETQTSHPTLNTNKIKVAYICLGNPHVNGGTNISKYVFILLFVTLILKGRCALNLIAGLFEKKEDKTPQSE